MYFFFIGLIGVFRSLLVTACRYFADAIEQVDPENKIEKEYQQVNDPNFGWRALRLLAKTRLHNFQDFAEVKSQVGTAD